MFTHTTFWWPVAVFLAAWFVISLAASILRNRARRQNMEIEARALGFTFAAWNGPATAPKFNTSLFRNGSLGFKNMMTGNYGGMEVQVFDFSHTSGGTTSSTTTTQTVAVYTQNVDLPTFAMGPGGLAAKIIDALEHQNVEVTTDHEFSRCHSVAGPDKERIKSLFNGELISFIKELDRAKTWQIEGAGKILVVYRYAHRVKPAQLREFLQETSAIAQSFFSFSGGSRANAFSASVTN